MFYSSHAASDCTTAASIDNKVINDCDLICFKLTTGIEALGYVTVNIAKVMHFEMTM